VIDIFSNTLGEEELKAVERVLASRWLGRGKECAAFEHELAGHFNVPQIMLLNSCTSAIYVGLRALGISPGDEVIISTVNFVACASAVIELGATPIFADVDTRTLNIKPDEITRLRNERTRAVIILHYGGHPARMREILPCAEGLHIVEDSANSVYSTYWSKPVGTFGSMGVWSFDSMKILVMGDGGALYLSDPAAIERAKSYYNLGLLPGTSSGMDSLREGNNRWWEYEMRAPAGSFISNDVQACMGRVQLRKLPGFVARRREIWQQYQAGLSGVKGLCRPPEPALGCESSYYLYWIQTTRRDEMARYLIANGVYCTFRYFPLHLVEFFANGQVLPNAEYVNETTLNLPLHQNLSDQDVDKIIGLVKKFHE